MNEQVLTLLLTEYSRLSDSFDKHATVGYAVLPLVLAGVGGYVFATGRTNELVGIAIAILLALAVAGIGIGHSILNRIGIRLIEVELLIRKGIGDQKREAPSFYTSYIGQGSPGLSFYFGTIALLALAALCLGMLQWWSTLTAWNLTFWPKSIDTLLPVSLNLALAANLIRVERTTQRQRLELLRAYEPRLKEEAPT
jgi:hypothetical protein